RGDRRQRQGRHGRDGPCDAEQSALAVAGRRRTRRERRGPAPVLALPAARASGTVRQGRLRATLMRTLPVDGGGDTATASIPAAGLQAVVFDMDGLMLDTERIALECWTATATELGWELARETCLKLVGLDQ